MRLLRVALAAGLGLWAASAAAQTLPAGPLEFAGGTIAVSGEGSVSLGTRDDIAFFNYTDYEHNALRLVRLSLSARWRPAARLAVLTELRSENGEGIVPYALFVRARPFARIPFDVQAGRIPPVFGAFARRSYDARDNPLIGFPLAYQYLTSLRPDAIPASADDLLLMRARGWHAFYPVGSPTIAPGVPLVSAYRWDTGVEGSITTDAFEAAVSVTSGTLSNPRVRDNNGGKQIAGRVAWKPVLGLVLGASAARGEFLDRAISDAYEPLLGKQSYAQIAFGADGEYSRGHWVLRGELINSRWQLPALGMPLINGPVSATSGYVEGRYRFTPRFFGAARVGGLTFSRVTGDLFGGVPTEWDAPVQRVEVGGGVYLQRNLTLRLAVQRNWRDGGRVERRTFVSVGLAYWF
jgi:hypothetical protein